MKLTEKQIIAPAIQAVQVPSGVENWLAASSATGSVATIGRGENGWLLKNDPLAPVRVAVSCLVEPMDGDRVLVAVVEGVWYVLAILEREWQTNEVTIDLGGCELRLKAADLHFEAEKSLELHADNLRMDAELSVQTASTQVVNVSGASILNAASVAVEGRQSLTMHTKLGVIQASALLKVDGTQMHFG